MTGKRSSLFLWCIFRHDFGLKCFLEYLKGILMCLRVDRYVMTEDSCFKLFCWRLTPPKPFVLLSCHAKILQLWRCPYPLASSISYACTVCTSRLCFNCPQLLVSSVLFSIVYYLSIVCTSVGLCVCCSSVKLCIIQYSRTDIMSTVLYSRGILLNGGGLYFLKFILGIG